MCSHTYSHSHTFLCKYALWGYVYIIHICTYIYGGYDTHTHTYVCCVHRYIIQHACLKFIHTLHAHVQILIHTESWPVKTHISHIKHTKHTSNQSNHTFYQTLGASNLGHVTPSLAGDRVLAQVPRWYIENFVTWAASCPLAMSIDERQTFEIIDNPATPSTDTLGFVETHLLIAPAEAVSCMHKSRARSRSR
jgi:hypothetical protein